MKYLVESDSKLTVAQIKNLQKTGTVTAFYRTEEDRRERQRSDEFRTLKEQAFQLGYDEYQAGVPSGTKSEKLTALLDSDILLQITAQDRHALIRAWRHGLQAKKNGTPITTREERDAAEKEKQEAQAVFVSFASADDDYEDTDEYDD